MEEIILQTKDLTKKYQNKVVVDNLNIQIKRGEIFGLLGPNGAGKSTTMNMISSIVRPTAGSIELFGNMELATNSRWLPYLDGSCIIYMLAITIVCSVIAIGVDSIRKRGRA